MPKNNNNNPIEIMINNPKPFLESKKFPVKKTDNPVDLYNLTNNYSKFGKVSIDSPLEISSEITVAFFIIPTISPVV